MTPIIAFTPMFRKNILHITALVLFYVPKERERGTDATKQASEQERERKRESERTSQRVRERERGRER